MGLLTPNCSRWSYKAMKDKPHWQTLLKSVLETEEYEITCEDCFDALDLYADHIFGSRQIFFYLVIFCPGIDVLNSTGIHFNFYTLAISQYFGRAGITQCQGL